jgi:hypothetical protein
MHEVIDFLSFEIGAVNVDYLKQVRESPALLILWRKSELHPELLSTGMSCFPAETSVDCDTLHRESQWCCECSHLRVQVRGVTCSEGIFLHAWRRSNKPINTVSVIDCRSAGRDKVSADDLVAGLRNVGASVFSSSLIKSAKHVWSERASALTASDAVQHALSLGHVSPPDPSFSQYDFHGSVVRQSPSHPLTTHALFLRLRSFFPAGPLRLEVGCLHAIQRM